MSRRIKMVYSTRTVLAVLRGWGI